MGSEAELRDSAFPSWGLGTKHELLDMHDREGPMANAVIVEGVRTPFVKAGGPLTDVPAPELGRMVVRELLDRANLDPHTVDELIAGNVASPADSANVARVIALRCGMSRASIAHTVNRNCASGMESVTEAVARVESGAARCVIALGVDSMSNIPVFWKKKFGEKLFAVVKSRNLAQKLGALGRFRPSDFQPQVGIEMGLRDPVSGLMMGDTAEKLARTYDISREEQDEFALRSHLRAADAWKEERLSGETMTAYAGRKSMPVEQDIGPRDNQSLTALAKLKPYFDRRWGTITVGNACQVTDGAVALLIMDEETAKIHGLEPLGRIRGSAYAGCDPSVMGLGPVYASAKALKASSMKLSEMELVEINEAFAAQVLACLKAFENPPEDCEAYEDRTLLGPLDPEILNVNGGAIALGHPVGATGTRLVLTALKELQRRNQRIGLATLCIGGGQGAAVIVERIAA